MRCSGEPTGELPGLCSVVAGGRGPVRELGARAHAELAVDVGEVPLDRLAAYDQGLRHFRVRAAGSDELCDPSLDLGQLAADGRSTADPGRLSTRALDPERSRDRLEDGRRLCERLACETLPPQPALNRPEREQSASALEWFGEA